MGGGGEVGEREGGGGEEDGEEGGESFPSPVSSF